MMNEHTAAQPATTETLSERDARRLEIVNERINACGHDPEVVKRGMGKGYEREVLAMSPVEFRYELKYVIMRGVEYAEQCARVNALRAKKNLPAGKEYCQRCGGVGGAQQWPGWVCFGCEGRGWVDGTSEAL